MAYNKFTIDRVRKQFQIQVVETDSLFPNITAIEPGEMLRYFLDRYVPLAEAIGTEKAKSEFIIAPILAEVRELTGRRISLFSGLEFNVDESQGLTGRCDYALSRSSLQFSLTAPILMLAEAKNDNINAGLGQCMAETIAAQVFNQQEENKIETIYGCVTTGSIWRFLQLQGKQIAIDDQQYFVDRLDLVLGILMQIATERR